MKKVFVIALGLLILFSCDDEQMTGGGGGTVTDPGIDLTDIPYDPVEYVIDRVVGFPEMEIPEDNPMTQAGFELGRFLFYDPILSVDSTISCSSCHLPSGSFTDNLAVSPGVDGTLGNRSSMSLLNIGYNQNGLFWDGRIQTLEQQALLPVEDPIEMHNEWPNVEEKLRIKPLYQDAFRRAFGISNTNEITKELAVKAIAQFERALVSSGKSKFDREKRGQYVFTEQEQDGSLMYFDASDGVLPDAQCFHCHDGPLLTDNSYRNNGITAVESLEDFEDKGRGAVTGNPFDNGKFRTPTLRNIEFTAPYMHDGRFNTLEEVIDDYNDGGHGVENEDQDIKEPFGLTDQQKEAVLAFIKTFRDTTFMTDPRYQNPFK